MRRYLPLRRADEEVAQHLSDRRGAPPRKRGHAFAQHVNPKRHVTFVSYAEMRIPAASARAVDFIFGQFCLLKEGSLGRRYSVDRIQLETPPTARRLRMWRARA
jgi:hypothetical protein